jgi:hypothetical protein
MGYPVTESCTIMLREEMMNPDVYRRGCTKIENILHLCSLSYIKVQISPEKQEWYLLTDIKAICKKN